MEPMNLGRTVVGAAHEAAWDEWEHDGDDGVWDVVVGDGIGSA